MKSMLRLLSAGAVPLALLLIANIPQTPLPINATVQMALLIGWIVLAVIALAQKIPPHIDYPPLWRTPDTEALYRRWEVQRGVRHDSLPREPLCFTTLFDLLRRIPRVPLFYVLLLALALRVWALDRTIPFLVDEAHFMQSVISFRLEPEGAVLRPINGLSPFTRIYTYGQWITSDLFGSNWFGFRVISAVIGTATVAALYVLAKALFPDTPIPLLSALLLTALPPHVHFSRLALIQIADGLVGTLALAGAAWALRRSEQGRTDAARWCWALSGAALGMTQYFYEGGRLFFPALWLLYVGGAIGWRLIQSRFGAVPAVRPATSPLNPLSIHGEPVEKGLSRLRSLETLHENRPPLWQGSRFHIKAEMIGFMRAVIVALLVAAPALYGLERYRITYDTRLSVSGLSMDYWIPLLMSTPDSGWLTDYLRHAAQAFTLYGLTVEQARYYGQITPLLLPYVAPFFVLGLIVALRRGKFLPLAWVLLTSMGSALLQQPAVASRFLGVLPALALLSACGVMAAANFIGRSIERPYKDNHESKNRTSDHNGGRHQWRPYSIAPNFLAFGITILLMLGQVYYYFVIHLPLFVQQSYAALHTPSLEDAALRAAALPAGTPVYLIVIDQPNINDDNVDLDYPRTMVTYFTRGAVEMQGRIAAEVNDAWLAALPPNAVLLVDPADIATQTMLNEMFDPAPPRGSPQAELPAEKTFQMIVLSGGAR